MDLCKLPPSFASLTTGPTLDLPVGSWYCLHFGVLGTSVQILRRNIMPLSGSENHQLHPLR